ncbi:MAG: hypothetical protein FWE88_06325 [Phycisphaerae bacterium]|nr:hypothetical protein [Phycisphaerae bacterium]
MKRTNVELKSCRFDVLSDGKRFIGLGKIWIGKTLVRSGRLPISAYTQTYSGLETDHVELVNIQQTQQEIRIRTRMFFRPMRVKIMRDHSYDPIHDLGDWDTDVLAGSGELDIVLRPASDSFNGVGFEGFSYSYEYRSKDTPIYYLVDQASWELGGDIEGATAISQSACSPPVATFAKDTVWSTEGILHFLVSPDQAQNPIMTHNLPRWASHGSFDYQYKGDDTLIGVFERVELIRSVQCRDADKPELKMFDKHIFDQANKFATSAKKIMLSRASRSVTDQRNLWGWVYEETDARARDEYGIREELFIPHLYQNFWHSFTVDSYYKDLLPAAIGIGAKRMFLDNIKKSAMTVNVNNPRPIGCGNMCCGHEYEIAPELGGIKRVKAFVAAAQKHGVHPMCWTNNDQAHTSPLNAESDTKGWYVRMEDARSKWGGAYAAVMSVLDMSNPEVRDYFVKSHVAIKKQTGMDAFFFDSFYNLGFMPVTFAGCKPRTMWKGLLETWRRLQQAGINLEMESFGPWGQVQHGHPSSYDIPNIFACYKVGVGNDYTTVPTGHPLKNTSADDAAGVYYSLAHMAGAHMPLHFPDGRRIDHVWGAEHRRALADYHAAVASMNRRYMQEDGKAILWHDYAGKRATVFNFAQRRVSLPGKVKDLSTGKSLPAADSYTLEPNHTYIVTAPELPRVLK